ncbi:MAG: hydrogenase [Cytophagales bacterium CG12_big_fil_rev_8_21_14_0_65_40_12]|nr:MAG: hydrogenase [Cytophagales bacterium CG12_big_fil_rev_8_21_14_0_65_40_12]PIW02753.1 MAG: hydrogenase [Cytophagales bacterium CG17_big_fil_post_rev_8_21_14_2_50_40_13]
MIVKRNLSPFKVWSYIQKPMMVIIIWSVVVWLTYFYTEAKWMVLNFTPIGILGSALAIFVAFRNNSAYGRWWEARQIWGGIVNSSRVLARLIITFADSHAHQSNYNHERSENFKKSLILKCIAWVNALRLQLRDQNDWTQISSYLSEQEFNKVVHATNPAYKIHMLMGKEIYQAMANGTLGGFDSFQIEGQLLALTNYQGGAERIKNTPLPRQYDYFTRIFVMCFSLLLPLGLLGLVPSTFSWLIIPFSLLVSGVFVIMERTGAANEDPFENRITDVSMTAICNTIERDLLDILGEEILPEKLKPKNGYLY